MANPLKTQFSSIAEAAAYLENEKFEQVFGDSKRYWLSDCMTLSATVVNDDENKCIIVDYIG
jgi:hypothetical protein